MGSKQKVWIGAIQQPEDSEKIAVISGILEIANLAISEADTK